MPFLGFKRNKKETKKEKDGKHFFVLLFFFVCVFFVFVFVEF